MKTILKPDIKFLRSALIIAISIIFCYTGYARCEIQVPTGVEKLKVITLHPDIPFILDANLSITVMQIIEEWEAPNRRSVMLVTLKMLTSDGDEIVHLSSDAPHLNWRNYKFEYIGGWRNEVKLQQTLSK